MKFNAVKCQDCGKQYAILSREYDGKLVCAWCDNPPDTAKQDERDGE